MSTTKKMLIVTDAEGKIIAAAHLDDAQRSGPNVGVVPLPGQTIHEVDVPEALTKLRSGHEFHLALSRARLNPMTGKIEFKPVVLRKKP